MNAPRKKKPRTKLTPMRPERQQPDVWQQINYAITFRLLKGFAIMRGGSV